MILQLESVTKTFGDLTAVDRVSLSVQGGEVLALLGENGAGKSTLMKVTCGLYAADAGSIAIDDVVAKINSPKEAVDHGICMVQQSFMLVPELSVHENVALGGYLSTSGVINTRIECEKLRKLAAQYNLNVDPYAMVWQLSVGEQQRVEILKTLVRNVRILIFDEPTAVLAPPEVAELYKIIETLKENGVAVIFISHKLKEVMSVSDRIVVMRRGKVTGEIPIRDATPEKLAEMMIGRPIRSARHPSEWEAKRPLLKVESVTCRDDKGIAVLDNLSLCVNSGEIVGIAGVDGNGQRELSECIAGIRRIESGKIQIDQYAVEGPVTDLRILGFIPEDSSQSGLVLDYTVAENMILKQTNNNRFKTWGLFSRKKIAGYAQSLIDRFKIRVGNPDVLARNLSGGLRQLVMIAREVSESPGLIVAAQPTRGLDVGVIELIRDILWKQRDEGKAILLISTELDDLLSMSDRVLVIFKGAIMGEVAPGGDCVNLIGRMMMGETLSHLKSRTELCS